MAWYLPHLFCTPFSLVQTLGYNPRQRWRLLHKNLEPTSRTCQFSTIHLSATPRVSLACHRFFPTLGCFRGPFSRPPFGLPDQEMDSFSSRTYHNIDWKKTRQFAASCLLFACTWGLVTDLSYFGLYLGRLCVPCCLGGRPSASWPRFSWEAWWVSFFFIFFGSSWKS